MYPVKSKTVLPFNSKPAEDRVGDQLPRHGVLMFPWSQGSGAHWTVSVLRL